MSTEFMLELYGYIGSVLVVVSLLMASVVKLRIFNTLGCIVSGSYALIIGSLPLCLMNGALIFINAYHLIRMFRSKTEYELVESSLDDGFVTYFLERYAEDIKKFFPGFDGGKQADTAYMVCCNGTPASILLGSKNENGFLDILLDYSTPAYRDCSVANYLYPELGERGISFLVTGEVQTESHAKYLEKMGFDNQNDIYVKKL